MKTLDRTDRDPFDRLAAARPTDESIASSWTPSRATTAFTHLRELADGEPATGTDSSNARHRARRWAVLGMAAAATAEWQSPQRAFLPPATPCRRRAPSNDWLPRLPLHPQATDERGVGT